MSPDFWINLGPNAPEISDQIPDGIISFPTWQTIL
jgi:hypothetical protein